MLPLTSFPSILYALGLKNKWQLFYYVTSILSFSAIQQAENTAIYLLAGIDV